MTDDGVIQSFYIKNRKQECVPENAPIYTDKWGYKWVDLGGDGTEFIRVGKLYGGNLQRIVYVSYVRRDSFMAKIKSTSPV